VFGRSEATDAQLNALEYQELHDGLKHLYAIVRCMRSTKQIAWQESMEPSTDWDLLPPRNETSDLMIDEVRRLYGCTAIADHVKAARGTEKGRHDWRWIELYIDDLDKRQQERFPDRR
jgi:hypothetical protein